MPVTAIVGAQWGDEGKGRVVDYLAQAADVVVRYQGGDNAGHTVVNEYGKFQLHLLPSGIFNPNAHCVIGAGTVVNMEILLQEIDRVEVTGVITRNLWVDQRAHLLLPDYRQLDVLQEKALGNNAIGTTKRGIGPAYTYKVARVGVRLGDLRYPDWARRRFQVTLERLQREYNTYGVEPPTLDALLEPQLALFAKLAGHVVDTVPLLRGWLQANKEVIVEGQLGAMRDLDWGVYPYVTSSNPTASYAPVGTGFPSNYLQRVIGVAKAYTTAVGAGPFPTEISGELETELRQLGQEFGATTGRPRRVGWFDAVAARYAVWLSGITELAITKLDVLDSLPEIKICTGYKLPDGKVLTEMVDPYLLSQVEPVWEHWPGWLILTRDIRRWEDLPVNAQRFLSRIETLVGVPITLISVGPERQQLILRQSAPV